MYHQSVYEPECSENKGPGNKNPRATTTRALLLQANTKKFYMIGLFFFSVRAWMSEQSRYRVFGFKRFPAMLFSRLFEILLVWTETNLRSYSFILIRYLLFLHLIHLFFYSPQVCVHWGEHWELRTSHPTGSWWERWRSLCRTSSGPCLLLSRAPWGRLLSMSPRCYKLSVATSRLSFVHSCFFSFVRYCF